MSADRMQQPRRERTVQPIPAGGDAARGVDAAVDAAVAVPVGRVFSHDTEIALAVLVALVNTLPQRARGDDLESVGKLRDLLASQQVSGIDRIGEADLTELRALRRPYQEIFGTDDVDAVAALVNRRIADSVATSALQPYLSDHDGNPWHLHYGARTARLAHRLNSEMAIALAHVVADGEAGRLAVCSAPDCGAVLIDLTRNRSKRYCDSRRCGNRRHVAAFRERQRAATGD